METTAVAPGSTAPKSDTAVLSDTASKPRIPVVACVLIACVLMFGNYIFAMGFAGIMQVTKIGADTDSGPALVNIGMSLITLARAIFFVWLISRYVLRTTLRGVGFVWTKHSLPLALVGWVSYTVLFATALVLTRAIGSGYREVPGSVTGPNGWIIFLGVLAIILQGIALQGIPEELLWRGWLMHTMAARPRLALLVSATVFGCLHIVSIGGQEGIGEKLIYCVQAFAFAFLAGALALRLRSLWAAVGVHAGMHLTILATTLAGFMLEGPTAWLLESVLLIAAGCLVLFSWHGDRVVMDR